MDDLLISVDINDKQIGAVTKEEAHRKGILHRAFSVFIYDGKKMLIQRRQMDKYHSGGLWANACCSHPRDGEELNNAVHRRLLEEMGFDAIVNELFHFIYRTQYKEDLYEYEYDHVFIGHYHGPVDFNESEVMEVKWMTLDEIAEDLVKHPENYASWFIISFPEVYHYLTQVPLTTF